MHVPKRIIRRLRDYDPNLRFRWSLEKKAYVLERKAPKRFLPKPVKWITGEDGKPMEKRLSMDSDRMIQYRDGYIEILTTSCVTEKLINELYRRDSWNGAVGYIRRLEEKERKDELRQEEQQHQELRDVSGESYDHLQWAGGSRARVGGLRDIAA